MNPLANEIFLLTLSFNAFILDSYMLAICASLAATSSGDK
jgi:hypothetical protein